MNGRMEEDTKESTSEIRSMDLVLIYILMEASSKANGRMASKMALGT